MNSDLSCHSHSGFDDMQKKKMRKWNLSKILKFNIKQFCECFDVEQHTSESCCTSNSLFVRLTEVTKSKKHV